MKQDGLNKEMIEAWRQGQSLIVVATTERSQNKVGGGGLNKHKDQSMAVEEKIIVRSNKRALGRKKIQNGGGATHINGSLRGG